jgi:hypothetical protein
MIPESEILLEIQIALDQAIDQISESISFPFDSENFNREARSILHRDSRDQWRKQGKCLYPHCNKKSIIRSHTLSRAFMLGEIQESQHVSTPEFRLVEGEMLVRRISVSEASTFPGLCSEHEGIFPFEKDGDFTSDTSKQLQLFRTVAREHFVAQHQLKRFLSLRSLYLKTRNKRVRNEVISKLSDRIPKETINSVQLKFKSRDWRLIQIVKEYLRRRAECTLFTNKFYRPMAANSDELSAVACLLPFQIPVALAGRATLHVTGLQRGPESFDVILNVIPHKTTTSLILLSRTEFFDAAQAYMELFTQSYLSALEMVEAWMLHGSDHWFIRPSVWNNIPIDRQKVIQNDILCITKGINQFYRHSIFDDLRLSLLSNLPTDPNITSDIQFKTIVCRNRRKLKRKIITKKLINHRDKIAEEFFAK